MFYISISFDPVLQEEALLLFYAVDLHLGCIIIVKDLIVSI